MLSKEEKEELEQMKEIWTREAFLAMYPDDKNKALNLYDKFDDKVVYVNQFQQFWKELKKEDKERMLEYIRAYKRGEQDEYITTRLW